MINPPRFRNFVESNPDWDKQFVTVVPKGQAAEVSEIVDTVSFLARRGNGCITGQDVSVNGGTAMP